MMMSCRAQRRVINTFRWVWLSMDGWMPWLWEAAQGGEYCRLSALGHAEQATFGAQQYHCETCHRRVKANSISLQGRGQDPWVVKTLPLVEPNRLKKNLGGGVGGGWG